MNFFILIFIDNSFNMKALRTPIVILTILLFYSCRTTEESRIVGIKIYDYSGDFENLTDKWTEMGINTAFVSTTLAANDTFRKALKLRGIPVFIIFPVFQNPELLKRDSTLFAITAKGLKAKDDWVEFVCPSRKLYRKTKTDELAEFIRTLDPDGISIDFIRQFVFWEMIYPDSSPDTIDKACYCDSCLAGFSGREGIVIPDSCTTTAQKAVWIDNNYSSEWNSYRCDLITTMVKELATGAKALKPVIKINFHAVPWKESDFGGAGISVASQDLSEIDEYVDYVSPMCYSQMLKRDASWISEVVTDFVDRAPGKILPSIQVYPYYINSSFNTNDFKQCLVEALKKPSCGVVFFSWPLFVMDSSRMEVVSGILGRKSHN